MNLARPLADVVPGATGRVLATLAELETPVTVRALGRHSGVSAQGALRVVNELVDADLVFLVRAGSAHTVSLNREHLATEPLISLVRLRGRLIEKLRGELAGWRALRGAWLFGSAARGDGGRDSDLDLLLVSKGDLDNPGWVEATGRLRDLVRTWTGNDAQLVEHTEQSFSRLVKRRNPLAATIRAEGVPLTANATAPRSSSSAAWTPGWPQR